MGTSFVQISNKGFWLRDHILELWLRLAALHIEDSVEENSEAHQIRDRWLLASRGFSNGCVPHYFEEAVSTEAGKKVVVEAINSLVDVLKLAPEELDKGFLNILGITGGYRANIETYRLLEISEAMLGLIAGKVGAGPADTSFMPGCR